MRKISLVLVCISILSMLFCACGTKSESIISSSSDTSENNFADTKAAKEDDTFDLEAYKENVQACRSDMYENATAINYVINYVINYAVAYSNIGGRSFDMDSAVENGFTSMEEKEIASQDEVESLHETIRDEYAALIIIDIEGNEAEELDASLRDMYDSYSNLYELLSTSFTDVNAYSATRDEYLSDLVSADDDLGLFLD